MQCNRLSPFIQFLMLCTAFQTFTFGISGICECPGIIIVTCVCPFQVAMSKLVECQVAALDIRGHGELPLCDQCVRQPASQPTVWFFC